MAIFYFMNWIIAAETIEGGYGVVPIYQKLEMALVFLDAFSIMSK